MPITRLWFFTLHPHIPPTDPTFLALWADILDLCASYTPASPTTASQLNLLAQLSSSSFPSPKHAPASSRPKAHHFLLQSTTDPATMVLVANYPSLLLCRQANAAYTARFAARMAGMVQHRALRQMDMEDADAVPGLLTAAARHAATDGTDGAEERPPVATITLTISDRDPLRSEVAAASEQRRSSGGGGGRMCVPPPDEEISGADVFELPPPAPPPLPAGAAVEGKGVVEDEFAAQRGEEGRRWIRLSRVEGGPGAEAGDLEVLKLREVFSR